MGMFCPFCRDVLAQGLLGRYDYLDAIGITHTCQHIMQSFESWVLHKGTKDFFISTPSNMQTPRVLPYLKGQLKIFKKQVEEWIGKEISDDDLRRGIEIVDRSRSLMRDVYETRKANDPPISGLDSMYMVVASQITDKVEFNQILEETLLALRPGDKQSLQPNQSLVDAEGIPQQPFTCRTNPQELFAMLMKEHSPEFFSVFELNNEVKAVIFADKKSDIGMKISNTINKFDPNISIEFETLPSK